MEISVESSEAGSLSATQDSTQSNTFSVYGGSVDRFSQKLRTPVNAPSYWKWYILVLASCLTFGGYYSFDFPSVTHNQLYRHFAQNDHYKNEQEAKSHFEFQFNLLFSLYSFPNTVLPFIGGVAADKFGNNKVVFIAASLVLIGNLLQSYGCLIIDMNTFLFGRFVFGLGAETLQVCANSIIAKWFSGFQLAFAMALNLSACKLPGVLTDWLSPYFESKYGVVVASFIVTGICVVCYGLTLLLIYEERKYDSGINSSFILKDSPSRNGYLPVLDDDHLELLSRSNKSIGEEGSFHNTYTAGEYRPFGDRYTREFDRSEPTDDPISEKYRKRKVVSSQASTFCSNLLHELNSISTVAWLLFLFTFFMYGTFIPFSNISNSVLLEVFYVKKNVKIDLKKFEVSAAKYILSVAFLSAPFFFF
jgi:MFS family permease